MDSAAKELLKRWRTKGLANLEDRTPQEVLDMCIAQLDGALGNSEDLLFLVRIAQNNGLTTYQPGEYVYYCEGQFIKNSFDTSSDRKNATIFRTKKQATQYLQRCQVGHRFKIETWVKDEARSEEFECEKGEEDG